MLSMSVTLLVLKIKGWLKLDAPLNIEFILVAFSVVKIKTLLNEGGSKHGRQSQQVGRVEVEGLIETCRIFKHAVHHSHFASVEVQGLVETGRT